MRLKWLYFCGKITKIVQRFGAPPTDPICSMRELHRFAQHATQLRRFSGKKDLPLGSSSPLTKSWLYVREILFFYLG